MSGPIRLNPPTREEFLEAIGIVWEWAGAHPHEPFVLGFSFEQLNLLRRVVNLEPR